MKKIGSLVLVLVMAASMAACSDANTIESKATGENSQVATTVDGGGEAKNQQSEEAGSVEVTLDTTGNFVFKSDDVEILLGGDPDAVIGKLGDAKSVLDVPSCAHDGTDRVYTYNNFTLSVYTATGSDKGYISDVLLISDLIGTPEGLEIGMDVEKARELYGDADKETDTTWIYKRGTSQLMLTLNGTKIISIEYMIP
ncbi:MAG: hypothetical protein IK020_11705 [Clostridiales bacterium]|nr:hypothetical protein [Clostridiales bacterium]